MFIKKIKLYVKFGISLFGVWRNIVNDLIGFEIIVG